MNDAPGRLQGRISVITGASRGLGAAIAKRFAGEGAHVVLVARTVGGLEEVDDAIRAEGGAATLVTLDLTEFDRIDEMGAALAERFGRIDVLVGNAGILGTLSPMGHIETQVWDRVIAVNLTANWRLIRSFDPLLRASDSGRAIFVTSGAADGLHPYWGAYAVSKAALEIMVKTWAGEVTKTPVKVNLVDPGALRTSMRAEAYPGEDPMTLKEADEITDTFVELAEAASTRHGEIVQAL
ncbi:MAG: SDR family NAD(P)-dependent oxidoreductase [Proteobacteria bacterium]|nr:SDR family NAD(P)-dependent oxidoreductase [Pseudomonadota bacterium]